MRTRIIIADQSEVRFYDTIGDGRKLKLAGTLANPAARLHDRDFKSDRPGRVFNGAAVAGRRRGASPHHSTGGERTPRRNLLAAFVRRIVADLERARGAREFDRIAIVAGPLVLGQLRNALTPGLRMQLTAAVAKDIVHDSHADVRRYFSRATLAGPVDFQPAPRISRRIVN